MMESPNSVIPEYSIHRRQQANLLILAMTVICAIVCFIPLFITEREATATSSLYEEEELLDDYLYGWSQTCSFREASWSCFMIVIVPAIDLLIEWADAVVRWRRLSRKKSSVDNTVSSVVDADVNSIRMTLVERTIFVVGIVFVGGCMSVPLMFESSSITAIYYGLTNASTVLTVNPPVMFLCRVSPTWTPLKALVVSACVCACAVLSSVSSICDINSAIATTWASNISMFAATGLFVIFSLQAVLTHFWHQSLKEIKKQQQDAAVNHPIESTGTLRDDIRVLVIVLHMVCLCILLVINSLWYFRVGTDTTDGINTMMYIYIAVAALVFTMELRVRKVEFQAALLALLSTKRQYVRYISHELRTPLNAAVLGLNMVVSGLKTSYNLDKADLLETLSDVQLACSTGVDILNGT